MDCPECGAEFVLDEFPYSDGVTCSDCAMSFATDWDYTSEDSMTWWIKR